MRSALHQRVRRTIEQRGLWAPGARVVVALSGGADSVAALLLLRDLATHGAVVLAGAAHLNHGLRTDAAADELFCRTLCARLELPLIAELADVRGMAVAARRSIESTGRDVRYAFLERARLALDAGHVAVAHTRDDQAETVLLRLLRGTGTRGLRGILPSRGFVVRPLLDVDRDDLRRYLRARGQSWREDSTNEDLRNPRNRVRHELLPLLASQYRGSVARVLARAADVASGDDSYLEHLAAGAATHLLTFDGDVVRLSLPGFSALPLALRRRVMRRALASAGCLRSALLSDIDRALATVTSPVAGCSVVAGVTVERFSEIAVLTSRRTERATPALPNCEVSVGGEVLLPALGPGWRLRVVGPITDREPGGGPGRSDRGAADVTVGWAVEVDAGALEWPLRIRTRLPGDRMRPKGVGGSKKLQDLFVDRKVARASRDRVPVVVDAAGRIVWVVGHAVAEGIEASSPGSAVVVLSVDRPNRAGPEPS